MQGDQVSDIVDRVLRRIRNGEVADREIDMPGAPRGVFKTVDAAMDAAQTAQLTLISMPLEKRREIIANIRKRCAEDVHSLARLAVDETGLGRFEDKIKKNLLVIHKTPGVEILQPTAWTGDSGLTLMERAPFGVIGSTDSHTGLATAEEANFWGKMANGATPERKSRQRSQSAVSQIGPTGWSMQAAGLAAVWAEANTRSAIVDAMQRKEVYASTGPRIRLRFFAGSDLSVDDLDATDWHAKLSAKAVPMGGDLMFATDTQPSFLVSASKDPLSANLDRIQIVKGWLNADGKAEEHVFDVVWAGNRQLVDGTLPAVAAQINPETGEWDDSQGAATLQALWQDPEFDPKQSAFYYVRVLQVPTPRHALLDAIALGLDAPSVGSSVIQERAYSSPIWFKPQ